MRVVFMGTPDFAACSLQALLREGVEVAGVFCQPDRPRDRGHKVVFSPVKETALAAGVPVYQPAKLRDGTALATLQALKPDLLAVVAYGRILPEEILALPPLGCVNVHGSLLPRYRGSAPIQRAVLAGETVTGVTTMYLSAGMDEGDMIFSESAPIREGETSGELSARLAPLGAQLLLRTLRAMEEGTAPRIPQDSSRATYAPPLRRDESPVDWTKPARLVLRQIYGLQPWPCATARVGGTELKLFAGHLTGRESGREPGTVLAADRGGLEIVCGDGQSVCLTEVQAPGGRRMEAGAYLLGHPLES